MQKIDTHTHIIPESIPDFRQKFGYGNFLQLHKASGSSAKLIWSDGKFFREVGKNTWDAKTRIEECDRLGVHTQVLSTLPAFFYYSVKPEHGLEICRYLNDDLAKTVGQFPKRFKGLGTLPLQSPELAIKELERCMSLGLSGIEIGSHVNNLNLNAPELFPVFQAASDLNAAIFVHPWDMMGMDRMPKYWLPWLVGMPAEVSLAICSMIFGGVFERLPKLRVSFAHGGGAFCGTLGRIERGFLARPDLCAVDNAYSPKTYLGKFFVDSLVFDPRAFNLILETLGEDNILLGSDYPFPLGEEKPGGLIESMNLSRDVQEKLFFSNAQRWLGMS